MIWSKANQIIGILRKLQKLVARSALLVIYKAFIRPHLDYRKRKSTQYNACLVMARAIKGSSIEKLWSLG